MSQLPPPPPPGVEPEDFAPIGVPQQQQQRQQPGSLTNGWAIASLVSGLLGCVPYVMGAIAVVTGIVGLKKTSDPRYTGRSMAIGGIVLGSLSLVFWLFFAGAIMSFFEATKEQRELARNFVQMVSAGAVDAAMERVASTMGRGQVEQLAAQMQEWGPYQDLTSHGTSLSYENGVTTCQLTGTATFASGDYSFAMTLIKEGDTWKVSRLVFD